MHIRGSPFSVVAKLLIQMLGTPMKIIENLSRPWGVAVRNSCCSWLQSGEIVVAENEHHCVSVFTKNGKVRIFRTKGSAQGQFNLPRGVAFDGTGDILVVDNHCIQKFTAEGKLLTAVGTEGCGRLKFIHLIGIMQCQPYRQESVCL